MDTKKSFTPPYLKEQEARLKKAYLKEMLLKKQEAKIKQIKPKRDPNDHYEWEFYPEPEGVRDLPQPKLWYLLVVLKKAGISLEQVGDEMGLTFLGNVINQFKLFNFRSCNYVCFLYNYFQKVSQDDWPAKHAILEKLTKYLPRMKQTRRKAEKSFNEWWLVANTPLKLSRYPQI